jgi:hypothetical protein
MATLQLNLIKNWFDLTIQGVKKEEYRDITPFWAKRLLCMDNGDNLTECYSKETIEWLCVSLKRWKVFEYASIEEVLDVFHVKFKEYQNTDFRNGYKPLSVVSRFIIENKGVTIGMGKGEWGFVGNKPVFIIHHGEVLESFNIKEL